MSRRRCQNMVLEPPLHSRCKSSPLETSCLLLSTCIAFPPGAVYVCRKVPGEAFSYDDILNAALVPAGDDDETERSVDSDHSDEEEDGDGRQRQGGSSSGASSETRGS